MNHIKKCLLLLLAVLLLCSCGVQDTPAPDPQPAPAESCTIGGSFTATVRDVIPDYCLDDTTPLVAVVTEFQSQPFTVYVGEELGKKLLEEQNDHSPKDQASYVGKTLRVLVDGKSDDERFPLTARTEGNRLVRLKGDKDLIGQFINVKITDSNTWALYGEAV